MLKKIINRRSTNHTGEIKNKLAFIYTGMGPQWWAMGHELYNNEPVYREALQRCDEIFRTISGWSIMAEMLASKSSSRIVETEIAQLANFLVQVGLTELWKEWGIIPDAVLGHSIGEVTAAYVARAINLRDSLAIGFHQSRLQQSLAGLGDGMIAADLTDKDAAALFKKHGLRLVIAAINSSTSITISGDLEELHVLSGILEKKEITHRFLRVEVAYHSRQMDLIKNKFFTAIKGLNASSPQIALYSSVMGKRVNGVALNASYWWKNIRCPVHFKKAVDSLIADGYYHFIEIGPHPVLHRSIRSGLKAHKKTGAILYSLRRKKPELETMNASLDRLEALGYPVIRP